jgi:hypothetical protein
MRTSIDPKTAKTLVKSNLNVERNMLDGLAPPLRETYMPSIELEDVAPTRGSAPDYTEYTRLGNHIFRAPNLLCISVDPSHLSLGTAKYKTKIVSIIKEALGKTLLNFRWKNRTFIYLSFVPFGESSKSLRGSVDYATHNLRSGISEVSSLTNISAHAMERLLERRRDVDIMKILSEEFDWNFVSSVQKKLKDLDSRPQDTFEFKMTTGSGGTACFVKDPGIPLLITTWYK